MKMCVYLFNFFFFVYISELVLSIKYNKNYFFFKIESFFIFTIIIEKAHKKIVKKEEKIENILKIYKNTNLFIIILYKIEILFINYKIMCLFWFHFKNKIKILKVKKKYSRLFFMNANLK